MQQQQQALHNNQDHQSGTNSNGQPGASGEISNLNEINTTRNENDIKTNEMKSKLWMEFDDFFVCFKYP